MTAGSEPSAENWAAATYEGAQRAQRRALAAATPRDRMEWLDAALDLALRSGALARVRAARQRRVDEAWSSP